MVAESQIGQVRDFPAYLHFTPRPDQPARFDEQTGFYECNSDGVIFLTGGNGAGCLAAEQMIYDPVLGIDRCVSEIDSDFHVFALRPDGCSVIAKAERPQIYGTAHLWEIRLSNSQSMQVTMGHRLLTVAGWREIGDILNAETDDKKCIKNANTEGPVWIESRKYLRTDSYWDFHVPEYENYWMAGVWNHNTTTCLLAKIARFIYETPPPREDTPFWVIAKNYDQVTKTCWKEKLFGQGHILNKDIDWARVRWYKSKERLPYAVPLKKHANGNNWMLEFKSYEQGIGAMMAQSIGGFGFVEQFPWGVFEEVVRGCREYNFPGSKLVEYTPVEPELSVELEEMLENGEEPETGANPNLRYLPRDWKVYHANTMCAMEHGHVDKKWFDSFFAMVPEDMRDTRMMGLFASFEGVVYKNFDTHTHCMGDEMWGRIEGCEHRRGIDWGAGPENDFVCIWLARNSIGQWFAYDEYSSNDQTRSTIEHLTEVYHRWEWPQNDKRYGTTYCDPANPDNLRIAMKLAEYNDTVENLNMMKGRNARDEGIEHIKYLLKPQIPVPVYGKDGKPVFDEVTGMPKIKLEPKLFIHRQNCPKLVQQFKTYRYLKSGKNRMSANPTDARPEPLKKNDHALDALRYGVLTDDSLSGATIASAKLDSRIIAQTHGQYLPPGGVKGFMTRHRERG